MAALDAKSIQRQLEEIGLKVAESQLRAQLHREEAARLEMEKAREEVRVARLTADFAEKHCGLPAVKGKTS